MAQARPGIGLTGFDRVGLTWTSLRPAFVAGCWLGPAAGGCGDKLRHPRSFFGRIRFIPVGTNVGRSSNRTARWG